MATNYPTSVDAFPNPAANTPVDSATPGLDHASHHANLADAVEAIETVLGTSPQGASADVKTRITTLEGKVGTARVFVGTSAPGSPIDTDIWIDTTGL